MTAIELTRAWFQRVWNERDEAAVHELLNTDAVIDGLGLQAKGPEGFLPFHQAFICAFESINVEITEIMEQEGVVMGHGVFTGIHHATQTPITIEFSFSARWENGQVVEANNVVDYLPMLSQLQLFSQDILGKALDPGED